jgi:TPR repeat protein
MVGHRPAITAITLSLALLTAYPATADFATASKAYDGGDYTTAFREWRKLAEKGDATAQIAIAELYRSGTGRNIDFTRAARWYRRAAETGNAVAQMNLAEMYEQGQGVNRDSVAAFVWYHSAAAQGRDWAAGQRDKLSKRMSKAQRSLAKKQLSLSH